MSIKFLSGSINNVNDKIIEEVKKNTPIIVCKNFLKKSDCKKIVNICYENFNIKDHRKKKVKNKFFDFMTVDVLPSNVKTNRIFRRFDLSDFFVKKYNKLNDLIKFQKKILKTKKNKKIFRKIQVIHYPRGGGFFGKHHHPRYPTNYGIIISLSEKGKDNKSGVTCFEVNKKIISLEKFDVTRGDLILFRYNLPHYVSDCDKDNDLTFDKKGRWTLIAPVYHKKF